MKHNLDSQNPCAIHTHNRNNGNSMLHAPCLIQSATSPTTTTTPTTTTRSPTILPSIHHALVDRLIRRPFVRQRFCIVVRRVLSCNNVSFSPYHPGLPLLDRHPLSSSISTTSSIHNHPFFFTPLYIYIVFSSFSFCTSYNAHTSRNTFTRA